MPYPYEKFRQNPFTSLRDKQTDRQTDRTKNITSFFGGGNYHCGQTDRVAEDTTSGAYDTSPEENEKKWLK